MGLQKRLRKIVLIECIRRDIKDFSFKEFENKIDVVTGGFLAKLLVMREKVRIKRCKRNTFMNLQEL